jgi:hypothetical protein
LGTFSSEEPTECRGHGRGRKEGEALSVYACLSGEAKPARGLICSDLGSYLRWRMLPPLQPMPGGCVEAQRGCTKVAGDSRGPPRAHLRDRYLHATTSDARHKPPSGRCADYAQFASCVLNRARWQAFRANKTVRWPKCEPYLLLIPTVGSLAGRRRWTTSRRGGEPTSPTVPYGP